MKKSLRRFITILILMATFLETILPINVYAAEHEVVYIGSSGKAYTQSELFDFTVTKAGWYAIMDIVSSNLVKDIFIDGDKTKHPKPDGNRVYLKPGVTYTGDFLLLPENNILQWQDNDNIPEDPVIIEENNLDEYNLKEGYTVEATGWYTMENGNDVYSIIYLDSSGDSLNPTIEPGDGIHKPKVYLVKGIVYYTKGAWILYPAQQTLLQQLKNMIARFIYGLANGLHYLVGVVLGESLTIDDLVFNKYSETNISFFDPKDEVENPSSLIYGTSYDDGSPGVGGLDSVVNMWYAIFIRIALMCYMIIFVYMGIRILLTSTADEKAAYKKLFLDWIIGLGILFLFPFVMKYMIYMNEGMVKIIDQNKGYNDADVPSSPLENMNFDKNFTDIYIDREIRWSEGKDYMSKIAYASYYSQEPAISIAFFIMTWQLITLIFHYYKRLFMVAFLIVIFPLVAFSYAVDKIADGKSQAFNTWLKEFMINVFAQTFHAIVYVFVCSTIYSAGAINAVTNVGGAKGVEAGGIGVDSILIIVGVTFLFKGEAIIRQIFGQISSAGTMRNLSDSAAVTFAKIKGAEAIIKGVGEYTIGQKSVAMKVYKGSQNMKKWNTRLKAFDKTATTPQEFNTGLRLEHAPKDPGKDATDEQKKNFLKERDLFNAAAIINNPKSHSTAEKAVALDKLKELAIQNPDHDVFKDTRYTAGQIGALANLDNDVEGMIAAGKSRLDIDREITLRMGIIFSKETAEAKEDITHTYYTAMFLKGSNSSITRKLVNDEIDAIVGESNRIKASLTFASATDRTREDEDATAKDAYQILSNHVEDVEKSDLITKSFAITIARLKQRATGAYTEEDLIEMGRFLREHAEDSEEMQSMLDEEFDADIDIFMHTLADTVAKESKDEKAVALAKEDLEYYETGTGEGYFYDEVPVHEVLKEKSNKDVLDTILEGIFQNKKEAMKEATEEVALEYLSENKVDIMEGYYDTSVRTQDGYTREELEAMKRDAMVQMFRDIAAVTKTQASENSASISFGDESVKDYLKRKEEERTGITTDPIEEEPSGFWDRIQRFNDALDSYSTTTREHIEKRKKEREDIRDSHFYGDIGDRK